MFLTNRCVFISDKYINIQNIMGIEEMKGKNTFSKEKWFPL